MNAFWLGVAVSVASGALVNEFCDVAPWLARRVIRWAARLWATTDSALASGYAVEWASVLEDCPGKVTKLLLALRFLAGAVARTSFARALVVWSTWRADDAFAARLTAITIFSSTIGATGFVFVGTLGAIFVTGVAAVATTASVAITFLQARMMTRTPARKAPAR